MRLTVKISIIVSIIAAISVAGALLAIDEPNFDSLEVPNPFSTDSLIEENNQFALDFYSIASKENDENLFFSPTSISVAFAIAYEGARGNTADEMQDVFNFPRDDDKRQNSFLAMIKNFNEDNPDYKLRLANALWLAKEFEPLEEYVDTAKTYYDSDVSTVDFGSNGIDLINNWVSDKTEGKIEKIFAPDSNTPLIQLAITNAIYFKGTWAEQFDKDKTRIADFYVNSDTTVQVPMMELETTFLNITTNENVWVLQLPYEGDKISMLILLPKDVDGMKSLEESLSVENLNKWTDQFQEMKTKVYLPKFQLETQYDLVSLLQELGIHDAFENADFSGISNSYLYIDKAVHKAFVDVNEEGTEAAAATGIVMLQSGPVEFRADHPFIFIIQDDKTGSILFMGKVVDPSQ